jgi:tRNA threonylcarbamoyladenosine biosynthesis protein TsaE
LGVEGDVTSPSFNLMNVYEGICRIYHFDLYRLETEE